MNPAEVWGKEQFKALLDIYRLAKVVAPNAVYGVIGVSDNSNLPKLHQAAVGSLVEAITRFEKAIPTVEA